MRNFTDIKENIKTDFAVVRLMKKIIFVYLRIFPQFLVHWMLIPLFPFIWPSRACSAQKQPMYTQEPPELKVEEVRTDFKSYAIRLSYERERVLQSHINEIFP